MKPSRHSPGPPGFAQVAALPVMMGEDGIPRVMLLTSRTTKRWIIPKGWPMKELEDWQAAAQEAREEAGLVGRPGKRPIGSYSYFKRGQARLGPCHVDVYLLAVEKQLKKWREMKQRQTRWCTFDEAAVLVQEPGLAALMKAEEIWRLARPD